MFTPRVVLFITMVCLTFNLGSVTSQETEDRQAVAIGSVNVRSSPTLNGSVVATLQQGEHVRILADVRENTQTVDLGGIASAIWFEIELNSGQTGFGWSGLLAEIVHDEIGLTYHLIGGVPRSDVDLIISGTTLAHEWLETNLSGDEAIFWPDVTITIYNTESIPGEADGIYAVGTTNAEPGSQFAIANTQWVNATETSRIRTAAHEWIHSWQTAMGCFYPTRNTPMYRWGYEGTAEYISRLAVGIEVDDTYIERLVTGQRPVWTAWELNTEAQLSYGWSEFAVDFAVGQLHNSDVGILRVWCENSAQLGDSHAAFEATFDMNATEFYEAVTAYAVELGYDPDEVTFDLSSIPDVPQSGSGCLDAWLEVGNLNIACQRTYTPGTYGTSYYPNYDATFSISMDTEPVITREERRNYSFDVILSDEYAGIDNCRITSRFDYEFGVLHLESRGRDCITAVRILRVTHNETGESGDIRFIYPRPEE